MVVFAATPAQAALPPGPSVTGLTGSRPGATQLRFPISDQVTAAVDVASGNLLVSTSSLSLVGVNGPVRVGQSYNSLGTSIGSTSVVAANRWTVGVDGAGYLTQGSGGPTYVAGDGSTWPFTGSAPSYTSPVGIKADLVTSGTGWKLTFRQSQQAITFNANGQPTTIADRNGNVSTIAYTGANPTSIVSSAGPVAARTATLSYNSGTYTLTASQTSGTSSRSLKYIKDAASNLTSIVDANSKTVSFGYTGSNLTSITSPTGGVTSFTYNSTTQKVEQISQTNTTAGSPGTSITRLSYPTTTQTLVAGPNTNQSLAVSAVPRTTYTVNASTLLVSSATDPMGRVKSATYTPNGDTLTSVDSGISGGGAPAGTTTAQYAANSGDSRTSLQQPTGSTSTAAYMNTAAATKYLPSSTTDDSSNATSYTYNGAGNALTSSSAMVNVATLTVNANGTTATALAPGNGTNKTVYAYDPTTLQLTSVTPVTGSSLGVRNFTYDDFGRTKTATNGRGITLTYTYDKQDRLLSTAFSAGASTVTNTYTDAGQLATRIDANGTTTYTYDQLNRLISRVNTFAGGTIGYGYDKASNLTTVTDTRGTTTNFFDDSGTPTKIVYVKGSGTQTLGFATDSRGRRTDSYLQNNAGGASWSAHSHQDYDTSGRVTRVLGETKASGVVSLVMDVSYCYNTASPSPTCATGATTDRSKLQWSKDNLSGQTTAYSYDNDGRLIGAAETGSGGNTTWAYTYDARGNRLTQNVTGGSNPSSQTLTFNAANQISTAGYTFDGTGNLTADPNGSYGYNGADQMTSVTKPSGGPYTYKYAGTDQNEVIEQQTSGNAFKMVYGRTNPQGVPVVEQVKIGTSTTAYVENDPVTGQPLMLRTSSGIEALYVYNGTGTPVALLTDFASVSYAYSFDPYGTAVLSAGGGGNGPVQSPFLFAGGIQDRVTGWVKFGARWYDPSVGRWTQQDTLDSPLDPANANRYVYAGGDPINNLDPTGEAWNAAQCRALTIFAAGVGLAATVVAGVGALTGPGLAVLLPIGIGLGVGAGVVALAVAINCS